MSAYLRYLQDSVTERHTRNKESMRLYANNLYNTLKTSTIPVLFTDCTERNNCNIVGDYYEFTVMLNLRHDLFDTEKLIDIVVDNFDKQDGVKCEYKLVDDKYSLTCRVIKE